MPLYVVEDGKDAMEFLRGADAYADRDAYPLPSLIFLDLKLPYVTGFDILRFMRSDQNLREIHVVILSGSDEPRDHLEAERLGVTGYLVKPAEPEQLKEILGELQMLTP